MRNVQLIILLFCAFNVNAKIVLPSIMTDHMVIQRGQTFKVYGSATSESILVVKFKAENKSTTVINGLWEVEFDPQEAGGPYKITIEGNDTVTIKDIYFGDVFLCSGQSNMAWPMHKINNPDYELNNADFPQIRLLTLDKNQSAHQLKDLKISTPWQKSTKNVAKDFSAIGFMVARLWHLKHKVPVGVIDNSWGGSKIHTWMEKNSFNDKPKYLDLINEMNLSTSVAPTELKRLTEAEQEALKAKSAEISAQHYKNHNDFPCAKYNALIAPLANFKIAAVLWYQGESDTKQSSEYDWKFIRMINSYRALWQDPYLPFVYVQLPIYTDIDDAPGADNWAELRAAQTAALKLQNTAMVNAIDTGDANDIHPKDKKTIAERMIYPLESMLLGKVIDYSSPTPQKIELKDDGYLITYDHFDKTLMAINGDLINGFSIPKPGGGQIFSSGKIVNTNQVLVYSPHPIKGMVRYLWSANPGTINLYNSMGNPAAPFQMYIE